jgi:hypothetical protein
MDKLIPQNQIVIMEALISITKDPKIQNDLKERIEWTKAQIIMYS